VKKVSKGKKGKRTENVNAALGRTLFNQLQLNVKRTEKKKPVNNSRLLHRRATLHTEQLTITNLEKRKKVLPQGVDPRSISPRSTRSVPSYARGTKASTSKHTKEKKDNEEQDTKLPQIEKRKTATTAKSTSRKLKTSR